MSHSDWLRQHTDTELMALAEEVQERAEQFDARVRQEVNDELRRRKLPLISVGRSRH
jgi:hypothetical protein